MANQYAALDPNRKGGLIAHNQTGNSGLETRRVRATDGSLHTIISDGTTSVGINDDGQLKVTQDDASKTEGGQKEVIVSDDNTQQLLSDILKEMKKMNIHMSLMTDTIVNNTEVE